MENRKKLLGWFKGFLSVAVLVSGLTLALAAPADANTLESGRRVSIATLAHPLAANPAVAPTPTAVPPARTAPPLSLTIMMICTGGALLLVFVVMILGFVLALERKKGDRGETRS